MIPSQNKPGIIAGLLFSNLMYAELKSDRSENKIDCKDNRNQKYPNGVGLKFTF
jgi:hypothetical protein